MQRRLVVLVVVLLTVLRPFAAGAEAPNVGTASTKLTLAQLKLQAAGLPVDLSLGTIQSFASTDRNPAVNDLGAGRPFALAALDLPVVGQVAVRSDGTTQHPGQQVALPGGLGQLTLGQLKAVADQDSASSLISALTGNLTTALAGVQAAVPASGLVSNVDATAARAANGAALQDVSLRVSDLLPVDLLEQLPLDVLLGLIDELNLPDLPVDELVGTLRQLLDDLQVVQQLHATIDTAQASLSEIGARLPDAQASVQALTATVATLQEQLRGADASAVESSRTKLRQQLEATRQQLGAVDAASNTLAAGGCELDALCTQVSQVSVQSDTLGAQFGQVSEELSQTDQLLDDPDADRQALAAELDRALADLAAANDLVDTLNALIDKVQAVLDDLVKQVNDVLDQLVALVQGLDPQSLAALVDALIDGLAAGELLAIDEIVVGVQALAKGDSSAATTLCRVEGVRLLGQAQEVSTCQDLQGTLAALVGAIEDLLDQLPLVGDLVSGTVSVSGLRTAATKDNHVEDGYSVASALVEGLDLHVRPVTLAQVSGGLVTEIETIVNDTLAKAGELAGVDAASLEQATAALNELVAELDKVSGELLGEVATPELRVKALDVQARSSYKAAGSAPAPVTPSTDLPRTGAATWPALALLALGAAVLTWLRSNRRVAS